MINRLSLRTVLDEKTDKEKKKGEKAIGGKVAEEKAKEFINALDRDWKCGQVGGLIY